jgi:hypothetical protein
MEMLTCKKQAHAWNHEKKNEKRRKRGETEAKKGMMPRALDIKHCRIIAASRFAETKR